MILTNEDRDGAGERYAYDLCGNRLLKEQYSGGSVDVAEGYRNNERNELTERIKAGSLTAYQYDKNGNIISEEKEGRRSEYRYDLLNRQTYVKTLDGRVQENLYDGENLRAGITENGKKTTFLYHNGEILTEFDGESAPIKRYLRGVGLSHVQTEEGTFHAYHQDEQGSTVYVTGHESAVENFYQYDAFGNLLEKHEDISNRILYTGQQYDQETGQYYLRARYYNPVVGRFLQEDTYRGDGLNLYAYCANNPVVYYDPSGHLANNCPEGAGAKPNNTHAEKVTAGPDKINNLLEGRPEVTGSTRDKLLATVQDSGLSSIVNELYRPSAAVGDGGTAAILVEEFSKGSSKHLIKATERLEQLKKLASSGKLGLNDLDVAEALMDDFESAINLHNR